MQQFTFYIPFLIKYNQLVILFAIDMQRNYSSKNYAIGTTELQMLHDAEHTVTILSIVV